MEEEKPGEQESRDDVKVLERFIVSVSEEGETSPA
jgi:hypothetical protein